MNIYRGMKNLYNDVYYRFHDRESLQEDPFKSIPNDVLNHVFSFLNFEKILKLALVNKNWKIVSDDPALLKYVIYRDKLINPDSFKLYLGYDFGFSEKHKAWEALPNNIGKIFKISSAFTNNKIGEQFLIFWIPKNITIKSIGKLLHGKFNDKEDYHFMDPEIYEKFGSEPIQESAWIAIHLDPRLKPSQKCCKTVLDIQSSQYRKPKIVEAIICLSFIYFKSKKLRKVYCEENFNGHQVLVKLRVDYPPYERRVIQGISVS